MPGGIRLAAIMSNGSNAWNLFTRGASLPALDIVLHSPQLRAAQQRTACALWVFAVESRGKLNELCGWKETSECVLRKRLETDSFQCIDSLEMLYEIEIKLWRSIE